MTSVIVSLFPFRPSKPALTVIFSSFSKRSNGSWTAKRRWAALLACLGLAVGVPLVGLLSRTRSQVTAPSPLPPLPQDPQIQVYFNHSGGADGEGEDLEAKILAAIASAQTQIDVAVQELRLPDIAQALIEKQRAGVRVRVILEHQYNQDFDEWQSIAMGQQGRDRARFEGFRLFLDANRDGQVSAAEQVRDAIAQLRQAQVPILDDRADGSKGSGLMHHKFVVVDGHTLVTGSANWTPSGIHQEPGVDGSRGNVNHLLQIRSPELAQLFTQEFEILWGDGPKGKSDSRFGVKKTVRSPQLVPIGTSSVVVTFSPTGKKQPWKQSTNGLIAQTLAQAAQQVDLALFVFSEQRIADALLERRDRNVQVRALIDPSFAFRDYSEGLDMLGVARKRKNCQVEKDNRPWQPPLTTVGVPQLTPGDSLHHKFAVLDQRTVITGSHNWSQAANEKNDETLLIIDNPVVAAHFDREFERLYHDAVLGIPVKTQQKLAQDAQRCGS